MIVCSRDQSFSASTSSTSVVAGDVSTDAGGASAGGPPGAGPTSGARCTGAGGAWSGMPAGDGLGRGAAGSACRCSGGTAAGGLGVPAIGGSGASGERSNWRCTGAGAAGRGRLGASAAAMAAANTSSAVGWRCTGVVPVISAAPPPSLTAAAGTVVPMGAYWPGGANSVDAGRAWARTVALAGAGWTTGDLPVRTHASGHQKCCVAECVGPIDCLAWCQSPFAFSNPVGSRLVTLI